MTYLWLALIFVAVAGAVGLLLGRMRAPSIPAREHWIAAGLTFVALAILTAIFDSVMIGSELFHYADEHLVGLKVGLAPIEDFSYPLLCVLLLPALWLALGRTRSKRQIEGRK